MELYNVKKDLNILCITARSFPDGIEEAFFKLRNKASDASDGSFFGISKPMDDVIVYKAGILKINQAEERMKDLEPFTIKAGTYLTKTLLDWRKNPEAIRGTFEQLLDNPKLDPASHCIEWYKGASVMCMVKLIA